MFLPDYFPITLSKNPFLYPLVEKGLLIHADLFFAHYISIKDDLSFEAILFLAFFSAMTRDGHLYVSIQNNTLFPSSGNLLDDTIILQGATDLSTAIKEKMFTIKNNCWYFHDHAEAEKNLFFHLNRLEKAIPFPLVHDFHQTHYGLTSEQSDALNKALSSSFTIICGGPGTGKTFTATVFLKQFIKMFPEAKITVTALTGKATANLKKAIEHENVIGRTLHSLLQETKDIQGFGVWDDDLIIVDESSMIDLVMMTALFSLVKQSCRIILLGDPNQLPPIGIGNPFEEMISVFPNKTIMLTKTLRTDILFIKEISEDILAGKIPPYTLLKSFNETVEEITNKFLHVSLESFPSSFCVLTPLKRGLWGSESLNKAIHNRLYEKKTYTHKKHPIMVIENRPEINIFNGDCGVLDIDKKMMIFEGNKMIASDLISSFSYNYVTSIHKSQGSEYENVLILLPKGCERFEKKLLYTAVTRAKKHVEIHAIEGIPEAIIKGY